MSTVSTQVIDAEMMSLIPYCVHNNAKKGALTGLTLPSVLPSTLTFQAPLLEEKYDIIIHNEPLNPSLVSTIVTTLNDKGIAIVPFSLYESEKGKQELALVQDFRIVVPFSWFNGHEMKSALFISHYFHPTADLLLHHADFLETLYYNADMHKACFALPNHLINTYKGLIKN